MKTLVSFLILLLSFSALLSTQVSGNQSGTWSEENNPYILIGDVTVPAGQTLTVNPGVIVQSQGNYQIDVLGQLSAVGTESDSIHFGITADNTGAIWNGLKFENVTGTNSLNHCDIRNALNGV
ncbi:MAG TPA: hypothetical protein PKK33_07280, partial [Candidatus Cloacimonadota bacterium]|nr:hypothetical protein [Candidatus Cloacimonadota bacterium]